MTVSRTAPAHPFLPTRFKRKWRLLTKLKDHRSSDRQFVRAEIPADQNSGFHTSPPRVPAAVANAAKSAQPKGSDGGNGLGIQNDDGVLRNGLQGSSTLQSRNLHERPLTAEEIGRLEKAAEDSANPQLKFIVALLILTRVRQRDLLEARWDQFDLERGVWVIPSATAGKERRVELSPQAVDVIRNLPRGYSLTFANPATQSPIRSF